MRFRSSLIGLAACVALAACDKKPAGDGGVDEKAGGEDVARQQAAVAPDADLSSLVRKYARWLPGDSLIVGALDVEASIDAMMNMYNPYGVAADEVSRKRRAALVADLSALSSERLGMDLTGASVLIFGVGIMGPSVVALGVDPKAEDAADVEGVQAFQVVPRHPEDEKLTKDLEYIPWAMALPGGEGVVLFPTKARLEGLASIEDTSLAKSDRLERYMKALGEAKGYFAFVGDVAFAANVGGATETQMGFPPPKFGALSVGEEVEVTLTGDEAGLAKLETLRKTQQAELVKVLEAEYARRVDQNGLLAAATVVGHHGNGMLDDALLVEQEGERLTYSFPAIYGGVFFMGVGAAIAIPAFLRSIKKSKAAEAELTVAKIANAVAAATMSSKGCAFPATPKATGQVPTGGAKLIAADVDPAWQTLGVSFDEPRYFAYDARVEDGRFVVRAQADFKAGGPMHTLEASVFIEPTDGSCVANVAPSITTHEFE